MGDEILQTLRSDNSAQKSFLQSRWYLFVGGIVLLCACVVCLVAVLLVCVDPFISLFRDDFVEVSSGDELDVAPPVVDSSIPDAMPDA